MVEFKILLDPEERQAFVAGQSLKGRVILLLDQPMNVTGIFIKVFGSCECHWVYQESDHSCEPDRIDLINVDSKEVHMDTKQYVLGAGFGDAIEIPCGAHTYNFECPLPSNLPESFVGSANGFIQYSIEAGVLLAKFDHSTNYTAKASFDVVRKDNLNEFPDLARPCKLEEVKHLCFLLCRSAPIIYTVSLPCSGFVPGQTVIVTLKCINNSDEDVGEISISLIQTITCIGKDAHGNCCFPTRTKVEENELVKVEGHMVRAKGRADHDVTIKIPQNIPCSSEKLSKIITISYKLKVIGNVFGWHWNTEMIIPITIGRIPLEGFEMSELPSGQTEVLVPTAPFADSDMRDASPAYEPPKLDLPPSFDEATANLIPKKNFTENRAEKDFGWNVPTDNKT